MPRLRTFLLLVLLAFTGCATAPTMVSDRLFFGRGIPGGGEVTEAQWNAFVAEMIVPYFPEGFTVWHGSGHWKDDDGAAVSEQTLVLEVVHRPGPAAEAKLQAIGQSYRQRFNQDAVMRLRSPTDQTFWRR